MVNTTQSYDELNSNTTVGFNGTNYVAIGMSGVTAAIGTIVTRTVKVRLHRDASATGSCYFKIWDNRYAPAVVEVASSVVSLGDITTDSAGAYYTFTLPACQSTSTTAWCFTITYAGTGTNYLYLHYQSGVSPMPTGYTSLQRLDYGAQNFTEFSGTGNQTMDAQWDTDPGYDCDAPPVSTGTRLPPPPIVLGGL